MVVEADWLMRMMHSGYIKHGQFLEMMLKLEPPLGFGRKCPRRTAYMVGVMTSLIIIIIIIIR